MEKDSVDDNQYTQESGLKFLILIACFILIFIPGLIYKKFLLLTPSSEKYQQLAGITAHSAGSARKTTLSPPAILVAFGR